MRPFQLLPVLITAACGRAGFDARAAPSDAAPDSPAPPIDAPTPLACNTTPRFTVAPTMVGLAAAPTTPGYDLFMVDNSGELHGFAYQFTSAGLTSATSDVRIAPNALGILGATAAGDGVLVAMPIPFGANSATSTVLFPLDGKLQLLGTGQVVHDGEYAGPGSLATSSDGSIALLSEDLGTHDFSVRPLAPTGADLGAAIPVINGSDIPFSATITAAGASYVVTWEKVHTALPGADPDAGMPPPEIDAVLLGHSLAVSSAVNVISTGIQGESFNPRVAYLASANVFLFAWEVKTDRDSIWITLRDNQLNPLPAPLDAPIMLTDQGIDPNVVASDDDFLVVWQTTDMLPSLTAERVKPDGSMFKPGVSTGGGTEAAWDLVTRFGRSALVWLESGGSGPNLWINPLCD